MLHSSGFVLILCFSYFLTGFSGERYFDISGSLGLRKVQPIPERDRLPEDFIKHRGLRFRRSSVRRNHPDASDGIYSSNIEKVQHHKPRGFAQEMRNRKISNQNDHKGDNDNLVSGTEFEHLENIKLTTGDPSLSLSKQQQKESKEISSANSSLRDVKLGDGKVQESESNLADNESSREVIPKRKNSPRHTLAKHRFSKHVIPLSFRNNMKDKLQSNAVSKEICCYGRSDQRRSKKEKKDVTFFGQRSADVSTEITLSQDEDSAFSVGIISECDFMDFESRTCWFEREVGDTLTLGVNVTTYRTEEAFVVRWYRTYTLKNNRKGIRIEMIHRHAPWNIVVGSGGMELRLSPITDTDMDPNSFVVRVYGMNRDNVKTVPKLIQEINFRINTIPIDMGSVYSGEEVNIDIENYISLPEEGVAAVWGMEKSLTVTEPLPSNMKTSITGRSMIIKELKRDQQSIISCIIFSSASIAVAKRRFKIQKPVEPFLKRSPDIMESPLPNTEVHVQSNGRRRTLKSDIPSFTRIKSLHKRSKRVKRGVNHIQSQRGQMDNPRMMNQLKKYFKEKHPHHGTNSPTGEQLDKVSDKQISEGSSPLNEQGPPGISSKHKRNRGLRDVETGTKELDFEDLVSKEVHYVTVKSILVTDESQERSMSFDEKESFSVSSCDSDSQCGPEETCIVLNGGRGYCSCDEKKKKRGEEVSCYVPDDDLTKSNPRQKRIRSNTHGNKKFDNVNSGLFYDEETSHAKDAILSEETVQEPHAKLLGLQIPDALQEISGESNVDTEPESPAMSGPFFDDEESYLLSPCEEKKQCNHHAQCVKPVSEGHRYCKCRIGFRGNGIFCWEDINYVPQYDLEKDQAFHTGMKTLEA